jgi:hypothetical protein
MGPAAEGLHLREQTPRPLQAALLQLLRRLHSSRLLEGLPTALGSRTAAPPLRLSFGQTERVAPRRPTVALGRFQLLEQRAPFQVLWQVGLS